MEVRRIRGCTGGTDRKYNEDVYPILMMKTKDLRTNVYTTRRAKTCICDIFYITSSLTFLTDEWQERLPAAVTSCLEH